MSLHAVFAEEMKALAPEYTTKMGLISIVIFSKKRYCHVISNRILRLSVLIKYGASDCVQR